MLILAVNALAVNGPLPLYIVSKSVICTPHSVKKCLRPSMQPLVPALRALLGDPILYMALPPAKAQSWP